METSCAWWYSIWKAVAFHMKQMLCHWHKPKLAVHQKWQSSTSATAEPPCQGLVWPLATRRRHPLRLKNWLFTHPAKSMWMTVYGSCGHSSIATAARRQLCIWHVSHDRTSTTKSTSSPGHHRCQEAQCFIVIIPGRFCIVKESSNFLSRLCRNHDQSSVQYATMMR